MPSLSDFAGHWRITRKIDDRRAGQTAHLTGGARFDAVAGGLAYHEQGWLEVGSARMQAERRYRWQEADQGIGKDVGPELGPELGPGTRAGRIAVFFDHGGPFHDFDPSQPTPKADHFCPPDTYCVRYDFTGWPHWTARWDVRGPNKDYTMITEFYRGEAP